ncbi:MAG: HD-GYP domain-containing protein [Sporomusaceae bacterium]|nr:HD-GYP domain-containing protein [Sporomusaceae bacterium]
MILAQDVVDKYGRILIASGITLKREIVVLLEKHEVISVCIKDQSAKNIEIETNPDVVSIKMRLKLNSSVKDAFSKGNGLVVHLTELQSYVEDVVYILGKRKNVLLYLHDLTHVSEYLFVHSVNVGLFSIVIGMAMNLPHDELCLLGMGGILHDFGKTIISPDIVNKQGPLNFAEFNEIKEHAYVGYKKLRSDTDLDYRIMFMVLQHHERCNGTGYPRGTAGEQIHHLARIVTVADVYDALTTDRVYHSRLSSFAAMQMINEGERIHFDPHVIAAFNKVAIPYHIGSDVILNNGVNGKVVRLNSANLLRPLLSTEQGMVNLLHEPDMRIVFAK